jgi:hypothetical protein
MAETRLHLVPFPTPFRNDACLESFAENLRAAGLAKKWFASLPAKPHSVLDADDSPRSVAQRSQVI